MKNMLTFTTMLALGFQLQAQVSFVPSSTPRPGGYPEGVTTADVNGDGKVGLISANVYGSSLSVLTNGAPNAIYRPLINVDFGGAGGRGYSLKSGFAGVGLTTNDFWNFYDRDASATPYDWRYSGTLVNLESANRAPTTVGMSVSDAPGAWGNGSSDPMYGTYIYPLDGGINVVTFTNLPAGQYDVLAYSQDGNYEVTVGGNSYGVKTTSDSPVSSVPVWTEGVQYARWRNVTVAAAQPLVLTVRNGVAGWAILAGVQILSDTPMNECVTPPSGLVSWWPAEGNANDVVGTNNGVAQNITYTGGEVGSAFYLNGSNAYVRVPASASLNVGAGSGFTFEAWINPADLNRHAVAEWNDGVGDLGTHLFITESQYPTVETAPPGCLYANLIDTSGGSHVFSTGGGVIVANSYQHIALTYDKTSGVAVLYRNGNPVLTSTLGSFTPQTSYDLYLGVRASGFFDGGYFTGTIDEPSLYNRALSATEIAAIYNAGSAGKCSEPLPPVITVQPLSQTSVEGSSVVLSVTATGNGPFSYQWSFNGTNISGATNATLTLTDLHPYQSGSYTVTITTPYGSTTSAGATVTVIAHTILIYDYSGQNRCTTAGRASMDVYAGRLFFIPDTTNGTFVGWSGIRGNKQYWVNPLSGYLLITVAGEGKHTITVLGQAGQGVDTNGYPHLWFDLHKGQNTVLTVAKNKYFAFPDTLIDNTTRIYPDSETGKMILDESTSFYNFLPRNTQDANNNGQTMEDLVNTLTNKLTAEGYKLQ